MSCAPFQGSDERCTENRKRAVHHSGAKPCIEVGHMGQPRRHQVSDRCA